jgi:hypothetical protein
LETLFLNPVPLAPLLLPPPAPQSYGDASSSSSLSPPPSAAAFAAPYLGAAAPPAGPPDGELGVSSARLLARMREVEQEGRIFNASAGYVKVRRVLVDFLCEAGEELRLHGSTMHVAVSEGKEREGGSDRALGKATRRDAIRRAALRACSARARMHHAYAPARARLRPQRGRTELTRARSLKLTRSRAHAP